MYAWIWRKLPFGLYGKLTGSLVLVTAVTALLWFYVFPWAQPLLPFDDVQVGTTGEQGPAQQDPGLTGTGTSSDGPVEEGYELPYSTESNNPEPTPTR
jgi:hypothetical protein